jgi:hypothetical protein
MTSFALAFVPQRLSFAKGKSDAVAKRDGSYLPRRRRRSESSGASDDEGGGAARAPRGPSGPAAPAPVAAAATAPSAPVYIPAPPAVATAAVVPHRVLLAQGLPPGTDEAALRGLFAAFPGFRELRFVAARGVAFAEFESEAAAAPALSGLHHFALTPTHNLVLAYAKK